MTAMFLASCGGGGNDSQSAEDIYRQTGNSAFVGDFEITNFTISPNPVVAGQNLRISYLATFTGQVAPARKSFDMTLFVEHESFSGASVSMQTFDLVSGNPGTGIYHAAGLALGGSTSVPGVVTYKIRLDPNAEGAVLVGTPGNAQVDVTIVAAPS